MKLKTKTKEKLILELIEMGFSPDGAEIEVEEFPQNAIRLVENEKVEKEKWKKENESADTYRKSKTLQGN